MRKNLRCLYQLIWEEQTFRLELILTKIAISIHASQVKPPKFLLTHSPVHDQIFLNSLLNFWDKSLLNPISVYPKIWSKSSADTRIGDTWSVLLKTRGARFNLQIRYARTKNRKLHKQSLKQLKCIFQMKIWSRTIFWTNLSKIRRLSINQTSHSPEECPEDWCVTAYCLKKSSKLQLNEEKTKDSKIHAIKIILFQYIYLLYLFIFVVIAIMKFLSFFVCKYQSASTVFP